MQLILSTCGTSLLMNGRSQEERKLVNQHTNKKQRSEIDDAAATTLSNIIADVRAQLSPASLQEVSRMSAELNALIKLYDGMAPSNRDHHILLCTDTWLGEEAAKLAEEWLQQQECIVSVKRQTDLQTASLTEFQLALSDLIRWCEEEIQQYKQAGYRIVFNLTGGFKSVQGFLQTLAMFYADEVVYIFESMKELLRIPRLPIVIDARKTVQENLVTFRRLGKDLVADDTSGIPETMLMSLDDTITLSPWGQLTWEQMKKEMYAEGILPSPSTRVRYGPGFEKSVQKTSADRCTDVNQRIDDLARFLETSDYNINSLDFKPLQGNPKPPSTHECDAWADQDARRIFGHFEDDVFVLDVLDRGLH